MRTGRRNKRLTIQYKTVARDSYGGETETWNDGDTVWASIDSLLLLSQQEYFAAQQIQADVTHKINIRYRKDITTEKRFKYDNNRYFDIKSVIDPQEKHVELIMMCKEEIK